jgi:hypothetical protein
MRAEAAARAAEETFGAPATTIVPPVRVDSMHPEDADAQPERHAFSQSLQTEEKENPKKRSLLRRISRAVLRY